MCISPECPELSLDFSIGMLLFNYYIKPLLIITYKKILNEDKICFNICKFMRGPLRNHFTVLDWTHFRLHSFEPEELVRPVFLGSHNLFLAQFSFTQIIIHPVKICFCTIYIFFTFINSRINYFSTFFVGK